MLRRRAYPVYSVYLITTNPNSPHLLNFYANRYSGIAANVRLCSTGLWASVNSPRIETGGCLYKSAEFYIFTVSFAACVYLKPTQPLAVSQRDTALTPMRKAEAIVHVTWQVRKAQEHASHVDPIRVLKIEKRRRCTVGYWSAEQAVGVVGCVTTERSTLLRELRNSTAHTMAT